MQGSRIVEANQTRTVEASWTTERFKPEILERAKPLRWTELESYFIAQKEFKV